MFTHRSISHLVSPILALFLMACNRAALQPGTSSLRIDSPPSVAPEAGRVRAEELIRTGGTTLYEALVRARPDYLRGAVRPNVRGETGSPSVRLNGMRVGTPDVLRLVQVAEVIDVRYWRPVTALTMYGATCDCLGGVIEVTTRRER